MNRMIIYKYCVSQKERYTVDVVLMAVTTSHLSHWLRREYHNDQSISRLMYICTVVGIYWGAPYPVIVSAVREKVLGTSPVTITGSVDVS